MKVIDKVFLRFVVVGIINTVFGTTVMFVLYNCFNFSYWISSAGNYILGSILSYTLNKRFTFKSTEKGWKPIIRFIINISVCYVLAYGMAKPLVRFALSAYSQKIQENCAMLVGMGLFVMLNYLGQRFFAFREKKDSE